jgi:hypothetical protein
MPPELAEAQIIVGTDAHGVTSLLWGRPWLEEVLTARRQGPVGWVACVTYDDLVEALAAVRAAKGSDEYLTPEAEDARLKALGLRPHGWRRVLRRLVADMSTRDGQHRTRWL